MSRLQRSPHASSSDAPADHPPAPARAALTSDQRARLLRRLLDERQTLMHRLARYRGDSDAETGAPNPVPLHMAELGTDTMQGTLAAAFASRDARTLTEIDEALRRFYRDPMRFGLDERTGAPISFERLDIIPWARSAP